MPSLAEASSSGAQSPKPKALSADPGLVCPLPCAYRLGSILPWPPQLPGSDNWAHGDKPTIVAYLYAIGERLVLAEQKMERLEEQLSELGNWGPTGDHT